MTVGSRPGRGPVIRRVENARPRPSRRCSTVRIAIFAALAAIASPIQAAHPETQAATDAVSSIHVEPAEICLDGGNRHQQILVTAIRADSTPCDVTRESELTVEDTAIATASN